VTTDDDDRALRAAFRFEAADLAANREGRLSPRQAALLRAGRIGMRLSLGVFAVVMLGSVGLVAYFGWRLETPGGWRSGAGAAAAVSAAVIAIGYLASRRHLATSRSRPVAVASGPVEILSDVPADCRVRIGGTPLRLPDAAALPAFQPGVQYRVHYLAGPVVFVLSAEPLGGRLPRAHGAADAEAHADEPAANAQIGVVRRGYAIVVLLGVLALGIPLAGVLAGDLPARLRPLAWIGLLAVALGFVWFARAWIDPGKPRRP
jgi:hypothetical protein